MELCFANRRKIINNNDKTITELKSLYPFLFSTHGIFKEFQLLMAININETLMKELGKNAQNV